MSVALLSLALVALTIVAYAGVRDHSFVNYDDDLYVNHNPQVRRGLTVDGLRWSMFPDGRTGNWHPLTWVSFMADVELFGPSPRVMLLTQVALHAMNVLLVFLFFLRTTRLLARSALVAALVAVHPMHVESVAWVSERKDVLCALFLLLALHAWVSFVRERSRVGYALALIAFICALMSKAMAITLPFALLLLDYWPLCRFELDDAKKIRAAIIEKIPFFLLIPPMMAITYIAQKTVGAVREKVPFAWRIENSIVGYISYIWKTVWPTNLIIPYPAHKTFNHFVVVGYLLLLAGITLFVANRARTHRYLIVGWLWFVGILVPVIGLVSIGSGSIADRFTYVPHLGLFAAVVWGAGDQVRRRTQTLMTVTALTLLASYTLLTIRQVSYWRDSLTLFSHSLRVAPDNTVPHTNLGAALEEIGDLDAALRERQAAVATNPRNADLLVNLAMLEIKMGLSKDAATHLKEASRIKPSAELDGLAKLTVGDSAGAVEDFARAVKENPDAPVIVENYAGALAAVGREKEAIAFYRRTLTLDPQGYEAHMKLGYLLTRNGQDAEAEREWMFAKALRPRSPEPYVYLSMMYAHQQHFDAAIREIKTAMEFDTNATNRVLAEISGKARSEGDAERYLAALEKQVR
jgi:Flp pilus assembly protein TadD